MLKIFYICDKKKECSCSPGCGVDCNHTKDANHALNGPSNDPMNDKRFKHEYGYLVEELK